MLVVGTNPRKISAPNNSCNSGKSENNESKELYSGGDAAATWLKGYSDCGDRPKLSFPSPEPCNEKVRKLC